MILPQTAEYALRVMAQMALLPSSGLVSREELAKRTKVPYHFLAKIMRRLVVAGVVDARRGMKGGFTLSRPLSEIRLLDVLEAIGYDFDVERCAFGLEKKCGSENPCPLHAVWKDTKQYFRIWSEKVTLEDVRRHFPETP